MGARHVKRIRAGKLGVLYLVIIEHLPRVDDVVVPQRYDAEELRSAYVVQHAELHVLAAQTSPESGSRYAGLALDSRLPTSLPASVRLFCPTLPHLHLLRRWIHIGRADVQY